MKLERINDNQIKCILNKNDLLTRNLNIADFSYGSEKTNELFKEMTSKAYQKFGFESNDAPLVIEAIPLSDESIELIISKSDDPDELDTRFSKFSPTQDDVANAVNESFSMSENKLNKANEILNLLSSFRDALAGVAGAQQKHIPADNDSTGQKPAPHEEVVLTFSFTSIDRLIELSGVLSGRYKGYSSIYHKNDVFYLLVSDAAHSPEEFNQICNIICEFGDHAKFNRHSKLFFDEHYDLILKDNALTELAQIR